jgi:hypothetical protein
VPGFPAPALDKIQKVEFVIRRVAVTPDQNGTAQVGTEEQAWVTVPSPSEFPTTPRPGSPPVDLAPRLTGNTRTWWPVPAGVASPEGEERFPMSRAFAPSLQQRGIYFGFLPLTSGEMYGPKAAIDSSASATTPILGKASEHQGRIDGSPPKMRDEKIDDYVSADQAGGPPSSLPPQELEPAQPLVPAPSNFSLSPASIKNWFRLWKSVLGMLGGNAPNGPRPKFESPRVDGDPKNGFGGGWAYVVRCVATLEPVPGCIVEQWGPSSPPALIAPHFDPFGGRPTQIEVPSPKQIEKMLQGLKPNQIAKRGGIGTGMKNNGCAPVIDTSSGVSVTIPTTCVKEICFLGIPLITICAYIMFSIALVIVIALFPLQIFLSLKFCLPIGTNE